MQQLPHQQTQQQPQHQQQQQQRQRRSKLRSSSSLVALLFALQGRKVTVELRNDVLVTGVLEEVDDYMNMYIDNAVWTPVCGPTQVCHALMLAPATLLILRYIVLIITNALQW
jgi:small nuclear ribonucleoprotein (snRNP)-like protein